ncbi:MAG: hypothetical protein ACFB15_29905 [Cyclobacteriaceae bacterium]
MYLKTASSTTFFHVDSMQIDVIDLPSSVIKAWSGSLPEGLLTATQEEWENALDQLYHTKVSMKQHV